MQDARTIACLSRELILEFETVLKPVPVCAMICSWLMRIQMSQVFSIAAT